MKLPVMQDRDDHVNKDLCGPCGGKCCKGLPGASFPQDWGKTHKELSSNLLKGLASGQWAIDWWEGDVLDGKGWRSLFVRPATRGNEGQVYDASWGGECTFHNTLTGCSIFDKRPTGCRGLAPRADGCTILYGSKKEACIAWYDFQPLLEKLAKQVEKEEEEEC